MKRMKVLISSIIYPNSREVNRGIYVHRQAVALAKTCEVKVIAPVPYVPGFLRKTRYGLNLEIPGVERLDGLEISHPRYVVTPKIGRTWHGLLLFLSLLGCMKRHVKTFSPDIILCYWAYPDGFSNVLFSKMYRLPVVIGCLGSDVNLHTEYFGKKKLITWSLKRANKTLVVSDAMRRRLLSLGVHENHIRVIPNGVDTRCFCPMDQAEARKQLGLDPHSRIILYVGRLSEEKGPTQLIEAFGKLSNQPNLSLVIVGSGQMWSSCHTLVTNLRLNEKVIMVGERPQEEVPVWLNAADLLCLPSLREGWPNVLMEALACGKPVVASRVGGVPEIVTSESLGLIAEPGNCSDLAEKIERALQTPWDRTILLARVQDRSWDDVASDVRQELERCLSSEPQTCVTGKAS